MSITSLKNIFSNEEIFSSEHVEQFIDQTFHANENFNETEQHYDTLLLDAQISCDEVRKAILKLKRKKSLGLDLLPPELFIDSADMLAEPDVNFSITFLKMICILNQ